ncbi:hypothetical protein [Sphingobium lignivorans]|uniref:Uncharacterized protein n=1 Tax=Sphingobium lignivorans TaxID=2735886 RepID=A0ABR6NLK1_9SPHN|nr:hypothetical protein [Sphingobium lignivorans]MBB5987398.1 hypothetical protein [Sphingobium lignivorans]
MNDFRDIFALTASREPANFGAVFDLMKARNLAALPWHFGSVSFELFELAEDPARRRVQDEVGCCLEGDTFYLGLFKRDGSASIAAMPGWMADGLAHFIHFDICGAARP